MSGFFGGAPPPEWFYMAKWRSVPGEITHVAEDDLASGMWFSGIAMGNSALPGRQLKMSKDPAGCSMEDFPGLPVVLDHQTDAESVVGMVVAAVREGPEIRVAVRLAPTERAKALWPAIKSGALRGLSLRYDPRAADMDGNTLHVRAWAPIELSICAIGWDRGAKIDHFDTSKDDTIRRVIADFARQAHEDAEAREARIAEAIRSRMDYAESLAAYVAREIGADETAARVAAIAFVAGAADQNASAKPDTP